MHINVSLHICYFFCVEQAVWRGRKARKYVCEMKAACKIQAWYRGWKARKEYLAVLKAVKIIQGCFRTKLERTR